MIPFFEANQNGYLYRVYITSSDLICIRLGKGRIPATRESRVAVGVDASTIVCTALGFIVGAVSGGIGGAYLGGFAGGTVAAAVAGGIMAGLIAAGIGAATGAFTIAHLIGNLFQSEARPDEVNRFNQEVAEEANHLEKRNEEEIRDYLSENKRGYTLKPAKWDEARIEMLGQWKSWFFGKPIPALTIQDPSKGKCVFIFRKKIDTVTALCELERLIGEELQLGEGLDEFDKAVKKYKKMQEA